MCKSKMCNWFMNIFGVKGKENSCCCGHKNGEKSCCDEKKVNETVTPTINNQEIK